MEMINLIMSDEMHDMDGTICYKSHNILANFKNYLIMVAFFDFFFCLLVIFTIHVISGYSNDNNSAFDDLNVETDTNIGSNTKYGIDTIIFISWGFFAPIIIGLAITQIIHPGIECIIGFNVIWSIILLITKITIFIVAFFGTFVPYYFNRNCISEPVCESESESESETETETESDNNKILLY